MKNALVVVLVIGTFAALLPINGIAQELPPSCALIVQVRRACEANSISALELSDPKKADELKKQKSADKAEAVFRKHVATDGSAAVEKFCVSQKLNEIGMFNNIATLLKMRGGLSEKCRSAFVSLSDSLTK